MFFLNYITFLLILLYVFGAEDRCRIYEFRCANTKCIPTSLKSDGKDDCGDNSDEIYDKDMMFYCNDSNVVSKSRLCDGTPDCSNDEVTEICEKHKCSKGQFFCRIKPMSCIDKEAVCNNVKDCADGYDESPDACEYLRQSKIVECNNETEFRCANKELCVSNVFRCDRTADCVDKSDEDGCQYSKDQTDENDADKNSQNLSSTCSVRDFYCGGRTSHECIPKDWLCDMSHDCDNGKDEENCPNFKCPPFKPLKCKNGDICYEKNKKCDGLQNCPDKSDESDCPVPPNPALCNPVLEFKCHRLNTCIPLSKVCDTKDDCGDGSDERPGGKEANCALTPCKDNNGGCHQECSSFFSERKCYCRPGYEIDSGNASKCVDINECILGMACSHICKNTDGSYECECFDGFYKNKSDSSRCVAIGEKFLLFSSKNSIKELRLLHHHLEGIAGTEKEKKLQVIALDFDYKSGHIFWSQLEPTIAIVKIKYKSSTNQKDFKQTLVSTRLHSPIGIAYDWIHGLLFWTDDFYKEISVLNVTSGHRRTLLKVGNDSKLRTIVVHPRFRKVYWTDWGYKPKIMSMGMDGKDIQTLVETGLVTPNGLAMDYYLNELYWVDARAKNIRSYNLKSYKIRDVVTYLDAHGFSLDIFEDWLYLSDWHNQNIQQIHKITGERKILIAATKPLCLKLMHQLAQPENIENACVNNPCQHLCLPSALNLVNSFKYQCQCADGTHLLDDKRGCTSPPKEIQSSLMNDSKVLTLESMARKSSVKVIQKQSIFLVVGFVSSVFLLVLIAVVFIGIVIYRNYLRKVIKRTTNFNNPVYYRKTSIHDLQILNPGNYTNSEPVTEGLIQNQVYQPLQV